MFLKAGAAALVLLIASRLFGLARESAQAAAFGASGLGDVAVLMLTLPDWFAGLVASGAMAYVLVPHWAGLTGAEVAASQRRLSRIVFLGGVVAAALLFLLRVPAVRLLAGGLPDAAAGSQAIGWSAFALPLALLAALWGTRLQHERDFTGMYAANLVVNACLIGGIVLAGKADPGSAMSWLGVGLAVAMAARLGWLRRRMPGRQPSVVAPPLPGASHWAVAALAAGLPLALPFAARSVAGQAGEGSLVTFNYAWKLVELPLILAIQLVGTLAFPHIARAVAAGDSAATGKAVRQALALAFALGCAAAAGLIVAAPAIARLLFGWGRMTPEAVATVARWGELGAWSLLPQAVIAVAATVLAARSRLGVLAAAYACVLAVLLIAGAAGIADGGSLMLMLDGLLVCVALILVAAVGPQARSWLPWRAMGVSAAALLAVAAAASSGGAGGARGADALITSLAFALAAAGAVLGATWWASRELRAALTR